MSYDAITMDENQKSCVSPALKEEQIICTPGLERSVNLLGLWLDTHKNIYDETSWRSAEFFCFRVKSYRHNSQVSLFFSILHESLKKTEIRDT